MKQFISIFFVLSLIATLTYSCKTSKKTTTTTTTTSTTTSTTTETREANDIPSFLARMVRDTRKADNTQSMQIDMFEKDGQQFYGFNNCNGCSDAMTIVYDISGKKIANCGGFAGFRGEFCEALAKGKTMYRTLNGKILVDEWKLGE